MDFMDSLPLKTVSGRCGLVSACEKVSIAGMRFIEYKLIFTKKSATILYSHRDRYYRVT
jgi:hypothetical protein